MKTKIRCWTMECLHSNWTTHICSFPKEISYLCKKNLKDIMITTEKKKKEIIPG